MVLSFFSCLWLYYNEVLHLCHSMIQNFPRCLLHSPSRLHWTQGYTTIEICPSSPNLLATRPCCNSTCLTLKKSRFTPSLQNRRNLSDQVLSIFSTKFMAAIFDFNGSGRLGRERNLYQEWGRSSPTDHSNSKNLWPPSLISMAAEGWGEKEICTKSGEGLPPLTTLTPKQTWPVG